MEYRVRRILNGELNLLSSRVSSQKRYNYQSSIQAGCDASSADDVAVDGYPGIGEDSTVVRHQWPRGPVRRYVPPSENTSRTT